MGTHTAPTAATSPSLEHNPHIIIMEEVDLGSQAVAAKMNEVEARVDARTDALEAKVDARTDALEAKVDAATAPKSGWEQFVLAWRNASYWWGLALVFFSLVIVCHGIAQQWNNPAWKDTQDDGHPVLEICFFFFMLSWIGLLEGCQISIVGLQGVDLEPFKDSHPRAYKALKKCYKGANVERFLVGRQFLLLWNGFLCGRVGGAADIPDNGGNYKIGDWEWDINGAGSQIFWSNSFLLIIIIVAFAQLPTQLLAEDKMLGFMELPFMAYYTVLLPTLFMEGLGLTHSAYFLKDFLVWACNIDTSDEDESKRMPKDFWYYFKRVESCCVVVFCGVFLFKGWFLKQAGATHGTGWEDMDGYAAIAVSVFFLFIMACAEGIQVSALALQRRPSEDFKDKPNVYRILMMLGGSDGVEYEGRNMKAFLVGRQFFVAMMVILLGRVTAYGGSMGELVPAGETDWGMGKGFNEWFLQTGFCGAIFVVNVAQLATQITASIFPVGLINNTFMYIMLQAMLFTEFSGLANACYPLMWFLSWVFDMEPDPQFTKLADKKGSNVIQAAVSPRE